MCCRKEWGTGELLLGEQSWRWRAACLDPRTEGALAWPGPAATTWTEYGVITGKCKGEHNDKIVWLVGAFVLAVGWRIMSRADPNLDVGLRRQRERANETKTRSFSSQNGTWSFPPKSCPKTRRPGRRWELGKDETEERNKEGKRWFLLVAQGGGAGRGIYTAGTRSMRNTFLRSLVLPGRPAFFVLPVPMPFGLSVSGCCPCLVLRCFPSRLIVDVSYYLGPAAPCRVSHLCHPCLCASFPFPQMTPSLCDSCLLETQHAHLQHDRPPRHPTFATHPLLPSLSTSMLSVRIAQPVISVNTDTSCPPLVPSGFSFSYTISPPLPPSHKKLTL